jgi:hypothetical protein
MQRKQKRPEFYPLRTCLKSRGKWKNSSRSLILISKGERKRSSWMPNRKFWLSLLKIRKRGLERKLEGLLLENHQQLSKRNKLLRELN